MNEQPLTAQDIEKEISDITEMAERENIKLSEENRKSLHDGMERVLEKYKEGGVTKNDLEFLNDVKLWLRSTEEMRGKLSFQQCIDLMKFFDESGHTTDWLMDGFELEEGKIIYKHDLFLSKNPVETLPDGFYVNGAVRILYTNVHKIPAGFHVNGDFHASFLKIKEVPRDINVQGMIFLDKTLIKKLPDNFTTKNGLDISHTLIEKLPKGLHVGGGLIIEGLKIEGLPDDLYIEGGLMHSEDVSEQVIKDAERLKAKGQIKGNISIISN